MTSHTLYGTPSSLYTGKARSYLIKNGLPYREVTPATIRFEQNVLPRAKLRMMPTIETSDAIVIRGGAAIVEHFESRAGHPASPEGPRQRLVSRLLDVIGMEGLLRPAMHSRWSFPEENHDFLRFHFASLTPAHADPTGFSEKNMGRMRRAAVAFGVVPETIEGIEERYLAPMEALDLCSGTPLERGVGLATFEVGGASINALAQPYRFHLLSRVQAEFDAMAPDDRLRVERMLGQCRLLPVLDARLKRGIGREYNLEVWH